MGKRKHYGRARLDSGQHRRILLAGILLGLLAFVPVALRLYQLMVSQYDYYAAKALRNQTRTTAVTAHRGVIYDRNMNILAYSETVENVYLNPHELRQSGADIQKVSRNLARLLELDVAWVEKQACNTALRYTLVKAGVDGEQAGELRSFIHAENISGIHLEPSSRRVYPYGTLAAQLIGFTNASNDGSEGIEAAYNSFLTGKAGAVITT